MSTLRRKISAGFLFLAASGLCALPLHAGTYPGDCNGDWTVSIGEVQRAVNMFLETEPPSCGVDAGGDGNVSIGEVQKVINCFLGECPAPLLLGLDTNGDGMAEVVDANGDGALDAAVPADCAAGGPLSVRLVALYAGPGAVFMAATLPEGMSLEPDGRITYLPPCSDEGKTFRPAFYLEGMAHWLTAPFLVTRTLHPSIVGLDTNGDGVAEIVDADGNGVLDAAVPADCAAPLPLSARLIARDAGPHPVFGATGLPQGMDFQPDGRITFAPPCAGEGATFTPVFTLEGQNRGLAAPFLVTRSLHPAILGLDTNGDGVADVTDADGDGMFDPFVEADCNHPIPFQFKLVAKDAGNPPAFTGSYLAPGMSLAADGTLTFSPSCDISGMTYMPSFSVDGSPEVLAQFRVVRLPWLALDLDGDGIAETRDGNGDGSFDCDMVLKCGQDGPTTFTLVAHDAGGAPIFKAADTEGWMTLVQGNQIQMTPPCDGVEGMTFHPRFSVEEPGGRTSPTVTLPVPVYRERYSFDAATPWYPCPQGPFPGEAVTFTALDRIWHYFGPEDRRTINQEVDFPQGGPWSQVGLYLRVECPESGKCDIWDRLATLQMVLNPADPQEQWKFLELTRYVTAYKIPMCEYIDVTPLASLLQGHQVLQSFIDTWVGPGNSSGEGWRVTVQFIFYPGPNRAADEVVNLYSFRNITVGQVDPEHNVDSQTPPLAVDIPADAWKVEAHLITTGHSFNNTGNCAEFCSMRQDLYVNGIRNSVNPWRGDCERNPVSPQPGTWKYDRNGWCPGSIVVGETLDITDQLVRGAQNTLDFDIRLANGSEYNNTNPDPWLPFEAVTLRLYIYR